MGSLRDAMAFLVRNYPYKNELSNARLTKMIYLADWRAAITRGRQITDLRWEFNHYGPYLHDVIDEARANPEFHVNTGHTVYGSRKQVIALVDGAPPTDLEHWEEEALKHVIGETSSLTWSEFIGLVYSTYPIVSQDRYNTLDLVELARGYQEVRESLHEK
jgi:hypothetical protein